MMGLGCLITRAIMATKTECLYVLCFGLKHERILVCIGKKSDGEVNAGCVIKA